MPLEIKITDAGLGHRIFGSGFLSDEEYRETFDEFIRQTGEDFKRFVYSLSDYSDVTDTDLKLESIQHVVSLCKDAAKVNPDFLIVFVANSNLNNQLATTFIEMMDHSSWEFKIFNRLDDAINWIKKRAEEKFSINVYVE